MVTQWGKSQSKNGRSSLSTSQNEVIVHLPGEMDEKTWWSKWKKELGKAQEPEWASELLAPLAV